MKYLLTIPPPVTLSAIVAGTTAFAPWYLVCGGGLIILALLLDLRARVQEYANLRAFLRTHPTIAQANRRIDARKRSWCQRHAAAAAFHHQGWGDYAKTRYRSLGYRAWHLFPDGTFSRDCPFLTMRFWRTLLGVSR